jgi:amino acid adenylation domain-containing protein
METSFALSPLQQGMLVQSIDKQTENCYVVQTVFAWQERISPEGFHAAWTELAFRHEVLRSLFRWKETGMPQQIVVPPTAIAFEVKELSASGEQDKDAALLAFLDADLRRGFGLSDAPPWRITLLDWHGSTTAVWTFHHLLLDGRSHILLLKELLAIYDGVALEVQAEGRPRIAQRHYAQWMEEQDFSYAQAYWKAYLEGANLPTPLPPPYSSGRQKSVHASYTARLGSELTRCLHGFSKASGISIGNIVQASWGFVLGWLANETDVVVGSVRACRHGGVAQGEHLIGIMINTLPLRIQWQRDSSIASVLCRLAVDWKEFRQYEHTPLTKIRQWATLGAGMELFSSAVSFSSAQFSHAVVPDEAQRQRRRFWLRQTTPYCSVDVGLLHDDAEIQLSLPGHLMEADLAGQIPEFLRNTIQGVVQDASQPVAQLSPMDTGQRQRLIHATNTRWEPAPDRIRWMDEIAEQARHHPDQTAITSGAEGVSWRELDGLSNQLAALLRERGLDAGDLVAVFLPRSPEFIWTCLGILKAGGAYLPMDAKWPAQRILNVMSDAKPFATITSGEVAERLPAEGGPYWVPELDQTADSKAPAGIAISGDGLAYVIYTSGSSGVPKGVEVTHGGLQNLVDDMVESFSLSASDRGSFLSNTSFDASVHEVWPLLAARASVHIPSQEFLADPVRLLHWIEDERITFSFTSVIMTEAVCRLARGRSLSLRYLLTGGDQLRVAFSENLCFQLVNEYGPTEYTVVATRYPVTRAFGASDSVPIGKPARGTRAYVMNNSQQLLPWGVPGELVLAGNGSARGYRNQPGLTKEKFLPNSVPEEPSGTLYRSGDLVRWLPDGNIQFLGRLDFQVKLRGFRIELGEIEACLLEHPKVAEAVVIYKSDPAPSLVAFSVARPAVNLAALEAELSRYLATMLPEYMVPAKFVFLDQLPTLSSAKYDRKQLAAIPIQWTGAASSEPLNFSSAAEKKMAEIWQDVLNIPTIRASDRFLSLGGTSLSIIRLICAVDQQFGTELPAAEVLRNPTPADLARLLASSEAVQPRPLVTLKGQGSKSPLFCIPGAAGGIHWFRDLAAVIDAGRPVIGVELLAFSEETQRDFSVDAAASEIAGLISAFDRHGECSLCGFSGGGILALEAAIKLEAQGIRVRNMFLLETYPPAGSASKAAKAWRWMCGWWSLPVDKRVRAITAQWPWIREALGLMRKAGPGAGGGTSGEMPKELAGLKQRHIEAFVRHRVSRYSGRVNLFFAQDRPVSVSAPAYRDWSRFLSGPVEETMLPGDHYSLLRKENVAQLAHCLTELLADAPGQMDAAVAASKNMLPAGAKK